MRDSKIDLHGAVSVKFGFLIGLFCRGSFLTVLVFRPKSVATCVKRDTFVVGIN